MGNRRQSSVCNAPAECNVTNELTPPPFNSRENAAEILQEYFKSIGGREKIFEQTTAALKGRKRGRQSNSATPAEKRSRKNGNASSHPADSTPPATAKQAAEWKPPSGSWDEEVDTVDMCQDEENGTFIVYLTWKNGKKTQHPKEVVYRRCPQKVRSKRAAAESRLWIWAGDADIGLVDAPFLRTPHSNLPRWGFPRCHWQHDPVIDCIPNARWGKKGQIRAQKTYSFVTWSAG